MFNMSYKMSNMQFRANTLLEVTNMQNMQNNMQYAIMISICRICTPHFADGQLSTGAWSPPSFCVCVWPAECLRSSAQPPAHDVFQTRMYAATLFRMAFFIVKLLGLCAVYLPRPRTRASAHHPHGVSVVPPSPTVRRLSTGTALHAYLQVGPGSP
jgi:hypothetical protein